MSSGGPVRPATSTRNGSAVAGSAQMSTLPTVVCGSVGVTRSPAASRPAIRRDGSAATGSFARQRQEPAREVGRQQVRRARQPGRGDAEHAGELVGLEVPQELRRPDAVDAVLAGRRELVGPPRVGRAHEGADPRGAGEQRDRRLQLRDLREPQAARCSRRSRRRAARLARIRARSAAGSAVTGAAGTRTALTPTSAAAPAPTSSQRLPKRRATVAHCAMRLRCGARASDASR